MTCLKEDEVIAIVSGTMASDALSLAESHMDGCRSCRLLLSALARQTGEASRVGDHLSAFAPGDLVGKRYEVIRLIGTGGMGEVYETSDLELGERVALKTIAVGTTLDESGVTHLKAEVQMARRVTHRNVCRVFDVGYHGEPSKQAREVGEVAIPFFTMELLPGETLGQLLRRQGPCSVEDTLILIGQVASGLDAAHRSGVIHTDLKSDNIMLVPEGAGTRVVITDFGLAMRLDGRARWRGSGLSIAGTIGYMAPEQFGTGQTGRATDIYALGVILFELLTGRLPFSSQELTTSTREGSPLPTPSLVGVPEIPNAWAPIITRCLDTSPASRFENAQQVAVALRAALQARSVDGHHLRQPAAIVGVAAILGVGVVFLLVGSGTRAPVPVMRAFPARSQVSSAAPPQGVPEVHPHTPAAIAPPRLPLQRPDAAPVVNTVSRPSRSRPRVSSAGNRESSEMRGAAATTVERGKPSPRDDDMIDPSGWR